MDQPFSASESQIVVKYGPGEAENHSIKLPEYVRSLHGFDHLWQFAISLALNSDLEIRRPPRNAVTIQITAEKEGSYEAFFQFLIDNGAGWALESASKWTASRFLSLWKNLISRHLKKRQETNDIKKLAQALSDYCAREKLLLQRPEQVEAVEQLPLIELPSPQEEFDDTERLAKRDPFEMAAEKIDLALAAALSPMASSCKSIEVRFGKDIVFKFELDDFHNLSDPLELPVTEERWIKRRITFERINRRTGRALIRFERRHDKGAYYAVISDKRIKKPNNEFTRAFDQDAPLTVWLRQRKPDRGNLNFLWEVSLDAPHPQLFKATPIRRRNRKRPKE